MINKVILLFLMIGLVACSPSEQSPVTPHDAIITLEAKSGILSGTTDFGSFETNGSLKMVTFQITNNGTEPLVGPASLDNSTFSLIYQNCPASLGPKKSCSIKVTFTPSGKTPGNYETNLNLDTVYSLLTATINDPEPVVNNIKILSGSSEISELSFGQLTENQNVLKSLTIKNLGPAAVTEEVIVSPEFILSYDGCSGKKLSKNSTCQVKISFNGKDKEGLVNGELSFAGQTVALSGEVITVSSGGSGSLSPNIVFESASFDMGSLTGSESKQVVLNIKNTGTLAAASSTATIDNPNFSILYNQCNNVSLSVKASCQVRIALVAAGKSAGNYSTNLSFGGKTQLITANITAPSNYKKVNFVLETKDGIPLDIEAFTSEIEYFNFLKDNNPVSYTFFGLYPGQPCTAYPTMSKCKFQTYEVDPGSYFNVSSGHNWYPYYYSWYYDGIGYVNTVAEIGAELVLFKDNVEIGQLRFQISNSFSYTITQDTKISYVIRCQRNGPQDTVYYSSVTKMCVRP